MDTGRVEAAPTRSLMHRLSEAFKKTRELYFLLEHYVQLCLPDFVC